MELERNVGTAPDAESIARSVRDPERFRPVFDRHFEAVRRYAVLRVGLDAAEDVAAETFAVALGDLIGDPGFGYRVEHDYRRNNPCPPASG